MFDNVSFTYTGKKEEMAIENVSFKANQGQITAIVGLSGGGKSTIANLISRFWDVTEGSVKIGGVDIRDISEKDLMNHVSFVFQDIFLFKQSILDNILLNIPLRVLTPEEESGQISLSGNDWEVLSEEDFAALQQEKKEASNPFAQLNGLFDEN